ncbi:MAG: MATE family efflux transporter [Proteobacteria bacterium]|nr:MATE family efflux transporter [Pseudomonadota bacterium]
MDTRTQQLLSAPPLPLLIRMATPNSIAFFIQAGVSMAEVWFVGQLGTTSLAAIALVFPLLMLTQMMSGGAMGGAVASSIARSLGAGNVQQAEGLIWHAIALAAAGAITFLVVSLLFGNTFLAFLGGEGDVLAQASRYCLILFFGGFFLWLLGSLSAVYRGMGNMQFPAMLMILNACIQVPLSGVLILGAFGVPSMGVVGAAVSAITSAAVVSSIMLWRLAYGHLTIQLRRERLRFQRELFNDILVVFRPASLSPLLSVATILTLTAIVGRFGEHALAGYGIGSRIEFLIVPLVFGLGAAMTSLVGMSVGAGDQSRAETVGWTGGFAACLVAGLVGVALALVPDWWAPLFTQHPEVITAATSYMQIVGPAYAFFGLGLSLYFASQGAGAMRWPVLATIARFLLAVGGALLLAFQFKLGLDGIFYAAAAAMVVYGVMIAGSIKLGAWRRTG